MKTRFCVFMLCAVLIMAATGQAGCHFTIEGDLGDVVAAYNIGVSLLRLAGITRIPYISFLGVPAEACAIFGNCPDMPISTDE